MKIPLSLAFSSASLPFALSGLFGSSAPSSIEVARSVLSQHPVIDGHCDLPVQLRVRFGGDLANSSANYLGTLPLHIDLPRLRRGKSGGFFSIAWVPCAALLGIDDGENFSNPTPQVRDTLEQIDITHQLAARYPNDVAVTTTPDEVRRAWKDGKIAHLIGIEGAHSLGNSLATMRMFARLGVRYLTLTHTCHNAFADSAGWTTGEELPPLHNGLSELGKRLIKELNRLGVMADLSHTSDQTSRDVIRLSQAPPFFSHSGARSVAKHVRNIPDDILESLQDRDAIVMVPFLFDFVGPNADIPLVADHVEYIARKTGSRSKVGIGSDFDGTNHTAAGLESVADYPKLFAELYERGWSRKELAGLSSDNFLRIFEKTLAVAKEIDEEVGDMKPWSKRADMHAGTGWF